GDQLVVEAFPFEATLTAEPLTPAPASETLGNPSPLPAWLQKLIASKNFALLSGIGGVAVLALFVVFISVLRGGKKNIRVEATPALEEGQLKERPLAPQDVERQIEARLAAQAQEKAQQEAEALLQLKMPAVSTKKTDVLTKHIAAEAKKDPTAMAQVVR